MYHSRDNESIKAEYTYYQKLFYIKQQSEEIQQKSSKFIKR